MTATIHAIGSPSGPSLGPLLALVASEMNAVNSVILERMQSKVALIPELAGHLIAGGGKRMRPMLTLASAALLDYPGTRHHRLAAAVEFIHTATLLHDESSTCPKCAAASASPTSSGATPQACW